MYVDSDDFEFWDCSPGQELSDYNGQTLSTTNIADLCAERAGTALCTIGVEKLPRAVAGFDPLATIKPSRWESAVTSAIYAVSGHIATRDEVIHGREVLDRLERRHRRALTSGEVLGILVPLLIGFRLSRGRDFVHEANRHKDVAAVFNRLLEEPPLHVEIPLCAHREAESFVKRRLAPAPDPLAVRRVCALLRMLMVNSRNRASRVTFLQQHGSERASSCMVPNMFLRYLSDNDVDGLISTLDHHINVLRKDVEEFNSDSFVMDVEPLDDISMEAESDLREALGDNWIYADEMALRRLPWLEGEAGAFLSRSALTQVARIMPEVGSIGSLERWGNLCGTELAAAATTWFAERSRMTVHGRALFEIAFYRRCAVRTRQRRGVGLGFDRDWSAFQRHAWHLAYDLSLHDAVPLAYARWNKHPSPRGALRGTNFRQFWLPYPTEP